MSFRRTEIVNKTQNLKHKGFSKNNYLMNGGEDKKENVKKGAPLKRIFSKNHNNENMKKYDENSYNISTKINPIMNVYNGMNPKSYENKNFDLNKKSNIKHENISNINKLLFLGIDMTTENKNIMNSEQQNRGDGIAGFNENREINNNHNYFLKSLRKYDHEYNLVKNMKKNLNNKNEKQSTNMALEKNRKTSICSKYGFDSKNKISQNNKNDENIKGKNDSKLGNYKWSTRKTSSKNKTKQNCLNDIYQKNVEKSFKKKGEITNSFIKKNDKKITIKNNFKVDKNEDIFLESKNKHFDLHKVSKNENEYFFLNGKEEKKETI